MSVVYGAHLYDNHAKFHSTSNMRFLSRRFARLVRLAQQHTIYFGEIRAPRISGPESSDDGLSRNYNHCNARKRTNEEDIILNHRIISRLNSQACSVRDLVKRFHAVFHVRVEARIVPHGFLSIPIPFPENRCKIANIGKDLHKLHFRC